MSVELAVDLTVPVRLAALLATARAVRSELLGLPDALAMEVAVGSRRDQGMLEVPGRRATPEEIEAIEIRTRAAADIPGSWSTRPAPRWCCRS